MSGKIKLLVVDDEKGMRETLSDLFLSKGFDVSLASDGRKALNLVKDGFFNVVLLDIRLPDLDGIEVLKKIKELSPDTEVIMITAFASIQSAVGALNEGAYGYIMKPFEFTGLIKTVSDASESRRLIIENRELRSFNENIVLSLNDGIIMEDEKGIISFVNPRVEEMLGYKKTELMGRPLEDFFNPEYKDLPSKRMTGQKLRSDAVMASKNGEPVPVLISTTPFSTGENEKNFLSVITEIADIKRLEDELKEKISELEHFNKLMVGRELKMVELKKRNTELESALKKKRL